MKNTSAESALQTLFASFGLPEEVVSDNGPQFTSSVFKSFLKNNKVKQTLTLLYHLFVEWCSITFYSDFKEK